MIYAVCLAIHFNFYFFVIFIDVFFSYLLYISTSKILKIFHENIQQIIINSDIRTFYAILLNVWKHNSAAYAVFAAFLLS